MTYLKKSKIILAASISFKGEYGICTIDGNKYFYKNNSDIENEKNRLSLLKSEGYHIPKLIEINDDNFIYYKFDTDLFENTLYDSLYFKRPFWDNIYNINKDLKNRCLNMSKKSSVIDTMSLRFYNDRLNHLEIAKSIFSDIVDIINDIEKNIKEIYNKKLLCYISNGDLTDTNICLNGKICDFENAGKNIVVSDLAIFFVSILYGGWIYPKYNKGAYTFRKNIIEKPSLILTIKHKIILRTILEIVDNMDELDKKYFKTMLLFRLMSPMTVNKLDIKDKHNVETLIKEIYNGKYIYTSLTSAYNNIK